VRNGGGTGEPSPPEKFARGNARFRCALARDDNESQEYLRFRAQERLELGTGIHESLRGLTDDVEYATLFKRPGLAAPKGGADQEPEAEDPPDRWACPFKDQHLMNGMTGEVRAMDCKRWSCIEHGPKLAWRWRQRVSSVRWKLMLTITNVPEDQAAARRAWQSLSRWLKRRGMKTYLRVMELGSERGMRHWHVLVDAPFVSVWELSAVAVQYGLGSVVWASRVRSNVGAVWYLLGYVFKSLGNEDQRQFNWRKVTVSRNIPSWPKVLEATHGLPKYDPSDKWVVIGGGLEKDDV